MIDGPDVLVVGAGPTGLTLALQACAHGADVRIIERRSEEFRPSRALIAHPRTLEVLRPLGVTDELLARADSAPRVCLHLGTRRVPVALAELDLPDTAFPHLTMIRQADVEAVLTHALAARGVEVDRSTELVDVGVASDDPRVRLRTPAGEEDLACPVVVGCDGAESLVRTGLGIGWPGGTYRREVVLADLDLAPGDDGPEPGSAHVVAGRDGLLFLFALGEGRPGGSSPPGRSAPSCPHRVGRDRPCRRTSSRNCSSGRACPRQSPGWRGRAGCGCSTGSRTGSGAGTSSWPATQRTPPHRPEAPA